MPRPYITGWYRESRKWSIFSLWKQCMGFSFIRVRKYVSEKGGIPWRTTPIYAGKDASVGASAPVTLILPTPSLVCRHTHMQPSHPNNVPVFLMNNKMQLPYHQFIFNYQFYTTIDQLDLSPVYLLHLAHGVHTLWPRNFRIYNSMNVTDNWNINFMW